MIKKITSFLLIASLVVLTGCASVSPAKTSAGDSVTIPAQKTARDISTPYAAAMACTRDIVGPMHVRVGVTTIRDQTGKVNFAEGGTGNFNTQGATDMFYSSLSRLGVEPVEITDEFRKSVDWMIGKGASGEMSLPSFAIFGSITGLDFLPGDASEFQLFGIHKGARAYKAVGRMDVRLTALISKGIRAGQVITSIPVQTEFGAIEDSYGIGTFVGAGSGQTYAQFAVSKGSRDPLQILTGYMVDYAATELMLNTVSGSTGGQDAQTKAKVQRCAEMLSSKP